MLNTLRDLKSRTWVEHIYGGWELQLVNLVNLNQNLSAFCRGDHSGAAHSEEDPSPNEFWSP